MQPENNVGKRTCELTGDEIRTMGSAELKAWMGRIMNRLYTLVPRKEYDNFINRIGVIVQSKQISKIRDVLIAAVARIRQFWEPLPNLA